jgi:hypothetical protein
VGDYLEETERDTRTDTNTNTSGNISNNQAPVSGWPARIPAATEPMT